MNLIAAVLSMPESLQLHLHRCVSASVRQWAWNLISPDRGLSQHSSPQCISMRLTPQHAILLGKTVYQAIMLLEYLL